jgi:putative ABC transport system permease protein
VAIGVASVVLLTSLGEGARRFVVGEFASLGSNLLIVIPGKTETAGAAPLVSTAPHDLTLEDAEALVRQIPQIRRVAPAVIGTASVQHRERSRDVTLVGTVHAMQAVRQVPIAAGRYLPPGIEDGPVCVIGSKVREELFGERNPLGELVRVGDMRFRVIGVSAARGVSIGLDLDDMVQIPVRTGLRLLNRTSLFRILAEVNSHEEIEPAKAQAIAVLTARHNDTEDVTVLTQDAVRATFEQILVALTAALAGIAAISLAVAGIGIMNVMLVSVSERVREIGLLKALGVTRRQVVVVFLLEAAIISGAGGALGLALGYAGGGLITKLFPDFPVAPPLWAVAAALGISISVGLLFGAIPARNAARLDPVEALMRKRA